MHFSVIHSDEDCRCPICGTLLLPPGSDDSIEDEDDADYDDAPVEWDSSWLCEHVHLFDFSQADEQHFATANLEDWWKAHQAAGWEYDDAEAAQLPAPSGWEGDPDTFNDRYRCMALRVSQEQPDISHFLIAEIDGGGIGCNWIAIIACGPSFEEE